MTTPTTPVQALADEARAAAKELDYFASFTMTPRTDMQRAAARAVSALRALAAASPAAPVQQEASNRDAMKLALLALLDACHEGQLVPLNEGSAGYVTSLIEAGEAALTIPPAASPAEAAADDVLEALDLSPETFRTEGGWVNKGKLRAAILHPHDYLPPDHWLQGREAHAAATPKAQPQAAAGLSEAEREADAFLADVRAELIRARAKFPGDRIMTIALAEEFGELCKAVLDEPSANVRKEAVQTAVMACRVAVDGDGSVDAWRRERGLDPLTAAALSARPAAPEQPAQGEQP